MTHGRLATGRRGEELAQRQLAEWGWLVRETNWRCALGEIDIVAQDGDWLVVVEVRARHGTRFGTPEESIGPKKQAKLLALGASYTQFTGWDGPWRIDVVAVDLDSRGGARRLAHYPNAVTR